MPGKGVSLHSEDRNPGSAQGEQGRGFHFPSQHSTVEWALELDSRDLSVPALPLILRKAPHPLWVSVSSTVKWVQWPGSLIRWLLGPSHFRFLCGLSIVSCRDVIVLALLSEQEHTSLCLRVVPIVYLLFRLTKGRVCCLFIFYF